VDDIIYTQETPFQDGQAPSVVATTNGGIVWQAVNDVVASGALYFSAAGNEGNKNDNTSGTWQGDFADGGTLALVPGGTVHDFGGGTQFDTITVTGLFASLFWADPLGGSNNDYDLFVLNSAGTAVVASSTNIQNGMQDPLEAVESATANNRLVILKKTGAASRFLYLENFRGRLSASTEGNMRGHACAAGAFSVAATPAANAFGALPNPTGPFPNPFTASNTVELFSSDGPRRIFFNANGTAITPGNFSATGGTLRQKPDITAADGVAVTGAGGFSARFFGTSAAAPHVGAIAALLKSANPSLTPAQVRAALTSTAIDIEDAGVDRDSGAGIVMAFEALQSIGAVASANLQTGTVAATETGGNGNTFIEPGENATLNVQLLNTGPVGATGVSAVLTTTTPGITITTGASAYANLPATTGAAINATPFAFNLTAAAACPLRIDFTLTVTFGGAGSPKVLPFTVQAGLPPLAITSTLDATAPNSGAGFTAMTGLQNLRLTRDGQFSVCGGQKTCPGTTGTGTRRYDAYSFLNCSTTPSCVTVNLGTSCSTTATALFAAAYLGNFDPNSICTNYLADLGLSPTTLPGNFSFTVPAGMAFTVVVSEVNPDGGANCNYTLNLSGLCCQSAGLCPTVSQIAPATSFPENNVMLAGANLSGVTAVKFAGGATAAFNIVSNSTLNVRVPNGAASGPLTLSRPGCPDLQTPAFTLASNLSPNNEIAVDDGSMEFILTLPPSGMSYFVNRLTPTSYPATVTKLAIFFPSASGTPPPSTPFDLLVGLNPGGGANIDGTTFTATKATTQPGGVFGIYNVPPQTITSGDFVVGFRIPFVSGVFPAALDTSSPSKGRSYTSTDGSSFAVANFNFGFRAATLQGCPNVTAVSPAGGAAGTPVTLTGTSLNGVTALKFFNNVTAQFTVVSPTQITTTVPNAAVTGPITLTKPSCPDMTAPVFFVGACPTASSVSPASGAVGKQVTINGTGFIGATAVKFTNNMTAAFTVNNDTQITATVPNGAVTGPITISRTGCADAQTAAFTVIVCSTITVAPASLPDGTGGAAYSQTLTASGGTASYSFAVTAGALPGGLTLASGGAISGTPNAAGTFNFTVTATDTNGCTGTRSYTINIAAPPLGAQNRLLYVLNDNTAGNQIYGYAANETTGALTLLAGFPFATGGNGSDAATSEMVTIDRANQRLYVINRGAGTVGAYSINATTGALVALPFSPINIGSGNWSTIAVHPNGSPLVIGDASNPSRILSFSITATTATAAAGSPFNTGTAQPFSTAFSQDGNFVYTGGNAGATFAGFIVNATTGVLTALAGSPFNSIGSFPSAYATDATGRLFVGNDAQVRVFTTPGGIPTAVTGNPFASGLTETDHGLLHPNGFYLVADRSSNRVGVYKINGTGSATTLAAVADSPFAAGGRLTDILALNQAGTFLFAANGDSRNLTSFRFNPSTGGLIPLNFQTANTLGTSGRLAGMAYLALPCPTIVLSPAPLPTGYVGTAYSQTVVASPFGNYNFAVTSGALPVGLSLNAATGAITGTPTTVGTVNFTITALSFGPCSGSQAYSMTIHPACQTITIAPASLPDGTGGTTYSQTLTASGGTAPYSFTVLAGALPGGLTLSTSGLLSGAPNVTGLFNFTIRATDTIGCNGNHSYTVNFGVPSLGAQTRSLYVLNDSSSGNLIYGYAVNEATGALTQLPGFPVFTGGNGLGFGITDRLRVDRANQRLYALNAGSGTVSAYAINPTTGMLTPLPFSPINLINRDDGGWFVIALHPSGSPLVAGNGGPPRRLVSYQITATAATAAAGSPYTTVSADPYSLNFSQDGNYVYAGGNTGTTFAGFSVDAATGVLTALPGSPFDSGGNNPVAYATDLAGRLFMANATFSPTPIDQQLRIFTTVNGIPSAASGNPFTSGLTNSTHGILHPNGFYLAGDFKGHVGVYRINGTGSETTLNAVAGSPFATNNSSADMLALNQAGTFLFAIDSLNYRLASFSVNPATGALTALGSQPAALLGTSSLGSASNLLCGMAYFAPPCQTVSLSPATLPGGMVGAAYNQTVSASPSGSYNFSVTAGALPAGLLLDAVTGAITGTPTMAGTANFTITALSFGPCSGSYAYSIIVQPACQTITGISPNSGVVGATVTITGTNFSGVTGVMFAGNATAAFTVNSNTQITTNIPVNAITGPITISKTGCPDATTASFAVIVCPTVTSVGPATIAAGGQLTITGSGLTGVTTVRFAGNASATFTVNSDTQITATVPARALSGAITLIKPGCQNAQTPAITIDTPRIVRAVNVSGAPGSPVSVPIELVSQGDENALGFSLTFDPAILSNPQAALGSDAVGGQINSNTLQTAQGRLGVVLSLGSGQRFNAGVRQMAVVTFTVAANTTAGATPVGFGDQPIPREVTSDLATMFPANYAGGMVTITPGYESDVAPRPNGNNNGQVTISDWVLTGRFAAGLDTPAVGSEFQRADCAPRDKLGDGRISLTDYVQAGRYAAGLDAVVSAGGPTAPISQLSVLGGQWLRTTDGRRTTDNGRPSAAQVRLIQDALAVDGSLMIELDATGAENALAFSLRFDSLAWRFISAITAGDAPDAQLQVNAAEDGRIGILLAMPSGQVFAAGSHRVVRINFAPFLDSQATTGAFSFADEPVQRAVANAQADFVAANYVITDGAFTARAARMLAGDFSRDELVSGAFVTALGDGLAVKPELADLSALPAELAGTRVMVRDGAGVDHAARLLFVSPSQINFQLPPNCAPGFATVTITSGEGAVSLGALWIGAATETPSANTGPPRIAAVLAQGHGTNEIKALNAGWISDDGESISLLIIGWRLRAANLNVIAGGETLAASSADYSNRLEQVQVRLPGGLNRRGESDVVLVMDGAEANAVRIRIQ
jgi:6-phosphogluconolactonase (cycloisomerase 2 family)